MKPLARWPWLLRFPFFLLILLSLWWGPIVLFVLGIAAWGINGELGFCLAVAMLFGWSSFIMGSFVHPRLEPFFNIRSVQNPHRERFAKEPVRSFRDFLRIMFCGR